MNVRTLALVSAFALALPVAANAQGSAIPRGQQQQQPYGARRTIDSAAYSAGFERGTRTGETDGRQNRQFDFASKSDYRNADAGWNRNYGDRELWRQDFRVGFESGYRQGYSRYSSTYGGGYGNNGNYGTYGNGTYDNNGRATGTYRSTPPPWANGRGRGSWQRNDLAFQNGFTDGYDAGLKDANNRQRFDPVGESRYRSGDHGYKNNYGTRDAYKFQYRDAFREGYEYGFQEATQYGPNGQNGQYGQYGQYGQNGRTGQYGQNGQTNNTRPWWWPW